MTNRTSGCTFVMAGNSLYELCLLYILCSVLSTHVNLVYDLPSIAHNGRVFVGYLLWKGQCLLSKLLIVAVKQECSCKWKTELAVMISPKELP